MKIKRLEHFYKQDHPDPPEHARDLVPLNWSVVYTPEKRIPVEWKDSLIWCPSQCEGWIKHSPDNYTVLYLRWRHDDPWSFNILSNIPEKYLSADNLRAATWTECLFADYHLFFCDVELEIARFAAMEIYDEECDAPHRKLL